MLSYTNNKAVKYFLVFLSALVVDIFLFPPELNVLPWFNFKQVTAVIGMFILGMNILRYRQYNIDKYFLSAVSIAVVYSVWNLFAVEINDQFDFSYANYITTFFVWIFSAYTAASTIRLTHGTVTIRLMVAYLTAVCVFQCLLALAVDQYEPIAQIVDTLTPTTFYKEGNRMYGLGAALDPAGGRFATVLIMISFIMTVDDKTKQNTSALFWYSLSFVIITFIGNMMSRTTITGVAIGLAVLILSTKLHTLRISVSNFKIYRVFSLIILAGVPTAIYLYNTDAYFYNQTRFAFEGFFALAERGEFTTNSTEILATMWKWPETTKGWIVGTGVFDNFAYGTDIGYCRLILYSGVIGFGIFSLLFIQCTYVFINRYRRYRYLFLSMLAMSFIIWSKVSTDMFQFWAFFLVFVDKSETGYAPKLSLL